MTGGSVKIDFDINKLVKKLEKAKAKGNAVLVNEVVKDSNYYIPYDEGELKRSAITASQYEEGKAIWDRPYAARLYYNPQYNFSKDKNPNARGLWFEAAKAEHKDKWLEIANRAFKGEL